MKQKKIIEKDKKRIIFDDDFFDEKFLFQRKKHKIIYFQRNYISRQKDVRQRHFYKKRLGFISWRKYFLHLQEEYILESEKFDNEHFNKKDIEETNRHNELLKKIGLIR